LGSCENGLRSIDLPAFTSQTRVHRRMLHKACYLFVRILQRLDASRMQRSSFSRQIRIARPHKCCSIHRVHARKNHPKMFSSRFVCELRVLKYFMLFQPFAFCRMFTTERTSPSLVHEDSPKQLSVATVLEQFAQLAIEQKELQKKREVVDIHEVIRLYPEWDPVTEPPPEIKTERELALEEQMNALAARLPPLLKDLISEDVVAASSLLMDFIKKSHYHPILPIVLRQVLSAEEMIPLFTAMAHRSEWREINLKDFMRILITHTRGINKQLGWNVEQIATLISQLPKVPISSQLVHSNTELDLPVHLLWQPEEIGEFLGRVVADEMELDFVSQILARLATKSWDSEASQCTWQEFMGYMSTIISSALAVNKHWLEEDFANVLIDVTNDIGKWALRKWDNFRGDEYMEFLVDLLCLLAIKWGRFRHDIRLLIYLTQHLCERWPEESSPILSKKISQRMFEEKRTYYSRLYHFIKERVLSKNNAEGTENKPPLLFDKELAKFDHTNYSARSKLWRSPI
jgi:hypothetical protein